MVRSTRLPPHRRRASSVLARQRFLRTIFRVRITARVYVPQGLGTERSEHPIPSARSSQHQTHLLLNDAEHHGPPPLPAQTPARDPRSRAHLPTTCGVSPLANTGGDGADPKPRRRAARDRPSGAERRATRSTPPTQNPCASLRRQHAHWPRQASPADALMGLVSPPDHQSERSRKMLVLIQALRNGLPVALLPW